MNITEVQLQKLMDLTHVSREDAYAALLATEGDLLDALLWLEREGKCIHTGVGRYSTASGVDHGEPVQEEHASEGGTSPLEAPEIEGWKDTLFHLFHLLVDNRLEAWNRNDPDRVIECPLAAALVLLLLNWWVVAGVLLVGMVLNWRYRLVGPQMEGVGVRDALDRVMAWLSSLKSPLK